MTALSIDIDNAPIAALIDEASDPRAIVTLAHGAGADMHHHFLESVATRLATSGITCLRHQFPYTHGGRRRIDSKPVLLATIRAVAEFARTRWPSLPQFVGGKSMGGRMATLAAAQAPLAAARGLILLGFPLHPPGAISIERAAHMPRVALPALFVQGTRDAMGSVELLRTCLPPRGRIHVIDHADHGFAVLRRSGRDPAAVLDELVAAVADFVDDVLFGTPIG